MNTLEEPAAEPMLEPVPPTVVVPEIIMAENAPAPFVIHPLPCQNLPHRKRKSRAPKKKISEKADSIMAAAAGTADDLTVVEGVGPKIQMLLNQYGIYSYRELAETDVERLKEILASLHATGDARPRHLAFSGKPRC